MRAIHRCVVFALERHDALGARDQEPRPVGRKVAAAYQGTAEAVNRSMAPWGWQGDVRALGAGQLCSLSLPTE